MVETPPLPEHPELRELAQALEDIGAAAEILDHKWRVVFTSTEAFAILAAAQQRSCLPISKHPASCHDGCPRTPTLS